MANRRIYRRSAPGSKSLIVISPVIFSKDIRQSLEEVERGEHQTKYFPLGLLQTPPNTVPDASVAPIPEGEKGSSFWR